MSHWNAADTEDDSDLVANTDHEEWEVAVVHYNKTQFLGVAVESVVFVFEHHKNFHKCLVAVDFGGLVDKALLQPQHYSPASLLQQHLHDFFCLKSHFYWEE